MNNQQTLATNTKHMNNILNLFLILISAANTVFAIFNHNIHSALGWGLYTLTIIATTADKYMAEKIDKATKNNTHEQAN